MMTSNQPIFVERLNSLTTAIHSQKRLHYFMTFPIEISYFDCEITDTDVGGGGGGGGGGSNGTI